MSYAPEATSFTDVIDTTDPQSTTDFCVKCFTPLRKEITLSNRVNIGICGIKTPKAISSEMSNMTYLQAPGTQSPQ